MAAQPSAYDFAEERQLGFLKTADVLKYDVRGTPFASGKKCRPRRRGTILAVTLALLTIVMLLGAALAKSLMIFHQQDAVCQQRQQALWLLESGVQRARHAAMGSENYEGELWRVPAQSLGDGFSGQVVIRVELADAPGDRKRRVTVEATYPESGIRRHVLVRQVSL